MSDWPSLDYDDSRNYVRIMHEGRARGALGGVGLTPRESAVVEQLLGGKANKEIACALTCSTKTVEFHINNVFRKIGVSSRLELVCRVLSAI